MKRIICVLLVGSMLVPFVRAQEEGPAPRFETVEIFVDAGEERLAAYQFELAAETGSIDIVGIEGGEHAAFEEPPYYDSKALKKGRIVIAAFNTGEELPTGKTRVARLHVMARGEVEYAVRLAVAGNESGDSIEAEIVAALATADQGEDE